MIGEWATGVLGAFVMAAVPAYFVLQPLALMRLVGRWKAAALAPLLPAIPAIVWSAYAFSQESNLWPLVFILFAPFGSIYLAALLGLARFKGQI